VAPLIGAVLGTGGVVQLWNARQQREAADKDRGQQLLLAREERDHQRAMVEAEHEHQRSTARDERTFAARSEAYIGLMVMLTQRMHDVWQVKPMLDRPPREWVQMSAEDEAVVLARVSAHEVAHHGRLGLRAGPFPTWVSGGQPPCHVVASHRANVRAWLSRDSSARTRPPAVSSGHACCTIWPNDRQPPDTVRAARAPEGQESRGVDHSAAASRFLASIRC
jgi:hypothetical protein